MDSVSGESRVPKRRVSGAFESKTFRSTPAGSSGDGFSFSRDSVAHGQDSRFSQQLIPRSHDFSDGVARHGCTWDNWRTSPRNNPTMIFKTITWLRVELWMDIPIFFFEKLAGARDQIRYRGSGGKHGRRLSSEAVLQCYAAVYFPSSFLRYRAGSLSNFGLHFLQHILIS